MAVHGTLCKAIHSVFGHKHPEVSNITLLARHFESNNPWQKQEIQSSGVDDLGGLDSILDDGQAGLLLSNV